MNEKKDEMIFVMICLMMVKEKKINRKKTHKEERRDLSLSLTLLHFLPPASLVFFLSSSGLFAANTR